jgi:hypothetical protein
VTRRWQRRLGLAVAVMAALLPAAAPERGAGFGGGPEVARDAFTTTAHEVKQLRQAGAVPVCRVRVAVWEPGRPDADRLPPRVRAGPTGGGPGERWLDIRAWDVLAPVLSDRIRLCREKGFTAVTVGPDWAAPAGVGLTRDDWEHFGHRVHGLVAEHGLRVAAAGSEGRNRTTG